MTGSLPAGLAENSLDVGSCVVSRFMNVRVLLFAWSMASMAAGTAFPAFAADPPAAPSAADRQAAAKDFAEGQRAFTLGDYPRAAQAFESAYHKAPHHSSLWNAARSWQRAGENARAANLYAQYLREAPANAPDRNSSSAALAKLTPKLARLDVHAGPGLTGLQVDGEPVDHSSIYVTPGTHLVEAMAGDQKVQQTQKAEAGAVISVALVAPPPPKPKPEPAKPAPPPPSSKLPPVVVYVGGAITVALAGATVWSGLNTWSQKDSFDASPTQANLDEGHSRQRRTNWLLGATGGAAALTTIAAVWLVDWKKPASEQPGDKPAGSVQLGLGPASVRLQGSF